MFAHEQASAAASLARGLLLELLEQVRGYTLQVLEAAHPSWLLWSPRGTSNHMLWHAGHAVWLMDVLGVELITGRSELPPGWSETFGMNCRPVSDTTHWPSRQEIQAQLERQRERLRELIGQLPLERLQPGRYSLAGRLIHGLHDEARHHGEMYLLFKLCRARNDP